MPTFDASTASCRIFTDKEGLLSRIAHDLELEVTNFSVVAEDARVEGTFNPRSVKVLRALRNGRPSAALSDGDKRDIEGIVARDVLVSSAKIRFVSTAVQRGPTGAHLAGTLTLNERTRSLEFDVRLEDDRFVAEVVLHQPDYGIRPYSAMMGSLKVKPDIRVRVSIPRWD